AIADGLVAEVVRQLVTRDPIDPGCPRASNIAEPASTLVDNSERLGEQIRCDLGVMHTRDEVTQDPRGNTFVKKPERSRIVARSQDQLRIIQVPQVQRHRPVYTATASTCYAASTSSLTNRTSVTQMLRSFIRRFEEPGVPFRDTTSVAFASEARASADWPSQSLQATRVVVV